MNAIERNAPTSELGSGVYTRDRMVAPTSANVVEDDALESLVRRASSRPPRPLLELDEYPSIPPLGAPLVPTETARVGTPLDPVTVTDPSISPSLKAAIAAPWVLLGVGAVAVALAWPRGESTALPVVATAPSAPTIALAAAAPVATDVPATEAFTLEEAEALEGAIEVIEEEAEATALPTPGTAAPESIVAAAAAPSTEVVAPVEAAVTAAVAAESLVQTEAAAVAAAEAPVAAAAIETTPAVVPEAAPAPASTATFNMQHVLSRIEAGPSTASTATAPAAIPDRPSRAEVAAALRRVHPAVDACTTQVGSATVRIVVANDGTVSSASATGPFAGTAEGACMAEAVRSARFPAFSASSMTIAFPFALR